MPHMLHLFNMFRENDGKENCFQVLEEELHRMLGIKYVNDEHDCNVVSMNSLKFQNFWSSRSIRLIQITTDYSVFDRFCLSCVVCLF